MVWPEAPIGSGIVVASFRMIGWRRPTTIIAAAAMVVVVMTAAAYVPSHLELPASWKDVNFDTATVSKNYYEGK